MTVYVIALGKVRDKQLYEKYVDTLLPLLSRYGAKILSVDDSPIVMDGGLECDKAVIIKFKSKKVAMDLYKSDEYQAILPVRKKAMPAIFTITEAINPY